MAEEKSSGVKTPFSEAVVSKKDGQPPATAGMTDGEDKFPKRTGGALKEVNRATGPFPKQD